MVEINFDGIPGPTHNYAGLSPGNLAAEKHARTIANPREAALQGLSKARALAARGIPQAVLPPHERPDVHALRNLGFQGSEARILADAAPSSPELVYSLHERGFALFSMRSNTVTRLYLQCAPDEEIANWPDDRIWEELLTRMLCI